jgi:prepilin-type processing-associated H-X9-DG protein
VVPATAYAPVPLRPPGPSKALAICALVFSCVALIPALALGGMVLFGPPRIHAGWVPVLAALVFIPLLALVGIVLGAIALIAKKPGKPMAVTGVILGVVLAAASVTAGVFLYRQSVRIADRVRCISNLHQIAIATVSYSSDNRMRLPPDRKRLEPYLGDSELWKCPSAKSGRDCDYVYLFRPDARYHQIRDPSMAILACDRKGNHREGRNVAFHDGHSEFMTEERFQARLSEEDNAEFARHLRKLEGQ